MKKFLSLLFCTAFTTSLFAAIPPFRVDTIRTVSNLDSAAQYRTIQAAVDASKSGDSIYVGGSSTPYDGFTITNKKLAVFGPGWSPDKANPTTAMVNSCNLTGSGTSGSELHGLIFTSTVSLSDYYNGAVNNVTLIRNKFQNCAVYLTYALQNYTFEGNWFDNAYLYGSGLTASNFILTNNIFYSQYYTSVNSFSGNNIMFNHNLWYGPSSNNVDCFSGCQNLNLINNIFIRRDAANSNTNSSFQNNITYLTTNDTPWLSANGNRDDGGNIAGKSPQMVDEASVESGTESALLNFTLSSASPAHNKGNDGKDMGLLYDAGRTNWARSRGANLPFISKMTLTSNFISVGSNLSVTVDAKAN